jgi:hypothetical protein
MSDAKRARAGKHFADPSKESAVADLLRINPLQAYLGGDIKDPEVTAAFLHNGINPILEQFNFGCIVVHHTPKTVFRNTVEWKAHDWMYAGAGSADITNWARAILVMDSTDDRHVFRFIAAKRGSRIGWCNEFTRENEDLRRFAHGDNGSIYWREATADQLRKAESNQRKQKDEEDVLALVPPAPIEMFRPELIEQAKKKDIGENKAKRCVAILIEKGTLEVLKKPRSKTKPAEYVRRTI